MNSRTAIVGMGLLAAVAIVALQANVSDGDWEEIRSLFSDDPEYLEYPQAQLRKYPRPPLPSTSPHSWLDYPQAALYSGFEGRLGFTVEVDPFGEVTDCKITTSSGVAALDAKACAMMMARAQFYPALDSKQQPTNGSFSSTVVFVISD